MLLEEHEFTWAEKKTAYLAAGPKEGPLLIFIHGVPVLPCYHLQRLT